MSVILSDILKVVSMVPRREATGGVMGTTSLFVDLLIIGIQVAAWLVLLVLSLFGFHWIDPGQVKGWEATIGILLLSIVYPIGVFVDHLADALLSGWRKRIRDKYIKDKSRTVMDLLMAAKDDKLSAYYDYLRIRIRISRSSVFNFAIIAVLFPIFVAVRLGGVAGMPISLLAVVVAVGSAAIAGVALYTWVSLTHGFYEKLVQGLQILARLRAEVAVGTPAPALDGEAAELLDGVPGQEEKPPSAVS